MLSSSLPSLSRSTSLPSAYVDARILFILVLCGIFMLFIYKLIHICLGMKYTHMYVCLLTDIAINSTQALKSLLTLT